MMRIGAGLRSILRNGLFGISHKLVSLGLRLFWVMLLARLLGAGDYGLYVYALSWYVVFMPLTALGQDLLLSREIGGGRAGAARVVSATLTLRVYATLIVMVLVLAAGWLLNPGDDGRLLTVLVGLAMLPRSLALWAKDLFLAHERTGYMLRQELIFRPQEIALGVLVLSAGGGLIGLALSHVAVWTAQAVSGLLLVHRRFQRLAPDWRIDVHALGLLRQGLVVGLSRVLRNAMMAGPVILFRQLSDDLETLGLVALCTQVFAVLRMVPAALAKAAMPVLSRVVEQGGDEDALFVRGMALIGLGQALVAVALFSTLGGEALGALLGQQFVAVAPYLVAVAWAAMLPALGLATENLHGIGGRLRRLLFAGLAGLGTQVLVAGLWTATRGLDVRGIWTATALGCLAWSLVLALAMGRKGWENAGLALGVAAAALWSLAVAGQQLAFAAGALPAAVASTALLLLMGWLGHRLAGARA